MSQLNSNKKGCGCLTITSALILSILGGGYLLSRAFLGQELTPSSGAKIIPDEALMTSYISTDSQNWSKLAKFGTPEAKQIITENWQNFTQDLTKNNQNIDYQKDIQPWLGGMMLTFLPSYQANADNNLVGIVGIKNKFKAWEFMQKLKKQPNSKITESKYKNTIVYNITDNQGNIFWATFFENYLVISNNQQNVEAVIDTFKGETSLAAKTKSSNIFAQKTNLKNPLFQIYLPDYDQFMKNAVQNSTNIPPTVTQNLKQVNSIVMGIGVEDNGIHFQAIADLVTPIDQKLLKTVSNKLISQMPNNTILMVNGQGINQFWTEFEKQKATIPELDQAISQWRDSLKNALDLDLDKDVFSWLDGEFAFGLFAVDNNSLANSGLGGLILIETGDRPTGENTLNKLKNISNQLPYIQITEGNSDGIAITKWQTFQSPLLSYGWLNNQNLMLTLGTDFSTTQNINAQNSLANNETFKLTTQTLPKNNFGYLYFDAEKALNLYKNTNGNQALNSKEAEAIANSLKGIAITSSLINPNTTQLDLLLTVKTNNN